MVAHLPDHPVLLLAGGVDGQLHEGVALQVDGFRGLGVDEVVVVGSQLEGRRGLVGFTVGKRFEQVVAMLVDEVLEVADVLVVAGVEHHFVVHAAADAPFFVVQLLRLAEQSLQAVDLGLHVFHEPCVEQLLVAVVDGALKPGVLPHAVDPGARAVVADVGHQRAHGAVLSLLRLHAVVVVVGNVVVPQRSPEQPGVVLLLIEVGAVEAVEVGAHLGTDVPVYERQGVYVGPVAPLRIGKVGGVECAFEGLVDVVLDVGGLAGGYLVVLGVVNAYGRLIVGRGEAVAVAKAVDLQQVAARRVVALSEGVGLLADVYAPLPDVNLVAYLVVALIDVVQHHVDELGSGVELERRKRAQRRGQRVAHQRLVAGVGQQRPLLGLGPLAA